MSKKSNERERKLEKREDRAAAHPVEVERREELGMTDEGSPRTHMPTPVRAERHDDADAFLTDPDGGPARSPDDLAELIAEEFVTSATSGEEVHEDVRDALTVEELGGPFVETSGAEEFSESIDEMNNDTTEREPFPTATRGM